MFPKITDILNYYLGTQLNLPIYSFGFMLASSILIAVWFAGKDIIRRQQIGELKPIRKINKKGKEVITTPYDLLGTIAVLAAVGGVLGSKIFFVLESDGNPIENLFSTGGLTFYGGFIGGAIAVITYLKMQKVPVRIMMDALAPVLILAYGIGRIGCHLSGDGDWGIESNLANKPAFVPEKLWAYSYPNNIHGQGAASERLENGQFIQTPAKAIPADQCTNIDPQYCFELTNPVYPTPIWEFFACLIFFGILWALRKHPYQYGWLFALYLVFNGIERFTIEKIRVNEHYNLFGFNASQAEIIATFLVLLGLIGLALTWKKRTA